MAINEPNDRLPAAVMTLWRAQSGAVWVIVSAFLFAAGWYWSTTTWAVAATGAGIGLASVATVAELVWLVPRRRANYRYQVNEAGIMRWEGRLWSRRLTVPASQVLYVDVRQGPIQRRLGLSTVRIGTLGSFHELGPVAASEATSIAARQLAFGAHDATQ